MATEKRLIYMEDAIALFERDIEENKFALRTAYHGDKETIRAEMNGMRAAISLVNSLARNGYTVDAVEVVRCKDCKYRADATDNGNYLCNRKMLGLVRPNDFCSFGERRTDGKTD